MDYTEDTVKNYDVEFSLLDVVRIYQEQGGFAEELSNKQLTDLRVMSIRFILDMAFHYGIQTDITIDFISEVIRRQQEILPFTESKMLAKELRT